MNHLSFAPTPINKLTYYSNLFNLNLFCKRDDLFAEAGGGSKARMLQYIMADVNKNNCDVVVTAGGPCSNFNRACALMCAKIGVKMHLIEYTNEPSEWESLNYYLCKLANIQTTRCDKNLVSQTIQDVITKYKNKSLKIKNIYRGGRSLQGIYAYYEAIREINNQINKIDHLFLACGTGTTLTGICAGMQELFPNAQIHAISTARTYEMEKITLIENISMLNNYLGTKYNFNNMFFSDQYLCGGYAKYTDDLFATIKECISKEGMVIDPTYSGKAFYGMKQTILKEPQKYEGTNVLFWNTGGIINLLSTKNDFETI